MVAESSLMTAGPLDKPPNIRNTPLTHHDGLPSMTVQTRHPELVPAPKTVEIKRKLHTAAAAGSRWGDVTKNNTKVRDFPCTTT